MRAVEGGVVEIAMSMGDSSACANCGLCAKRQEARIVALSAAEQPHVSVGDKVSVAIDTPSPYLAAWLLFVQPLILLIAGIAAGVEIGGALGGAWSAICGFGLPVLLVAANYIVVAWLERRVLAIRRARGRVLEVL